MSAVIPPAAAQKILAEADASSGTDQALDRIASAHGLLLTELRALMARRPRKPTVPGFTPRRPTPPRPQPPQERHMSIAPDLPPDTQRPDPYVTALPVSRLDVDHTYQRELDVLRVQRMVTAYDVALVGILEVSARPGNRFTILDGQHRWATVKDRAFGTLDEDPHVVCRVHQGLTIAEEAALYHQLNTTRKQLTGWDRWLARRGAGDPAVLEIETTVAEHGYTVGMTTAPAVLRATKACENVVALGGIGLLGNVLATVRAAYADDQAGLDAAILHGLGQVLHAYNRDELDVERLVDVLAGIVPRQLTARAAAMREIHKGTLDRLTAHVIVDRYNATKGPKLEAFFDRVKPLSKTKGPKARLGLAIREWAERTGRPVGKNITKKLRAEYAAAHPTQEAETA